MNNKNSKVYLIFIALILVVTFFLPFAARSLGMFIKESQTFDRDGYEEMIKSAYKFPKIADLETAFSGLTTKFNYKAIEVDDFDGVKGTEFPFGR